MLKEANIGQRIPIYSTFRKPVIYGEEKSELMPRNDDFEKVYASALTEEELKQRLHLRIDAWKWDEK